MTHLFKPRIPYPYVSIVLRFTLNLCVKKGPYINIDVPAGVGIPPLDTQSLEWFRLHRCMDLSFSKMVVGSMVMSLCGSVVLGSKLCGVGETNSLDWRNL